MRCESNATHALDVAAWLDEANIAWIADTTTWTDAVWFRIAVEGVDFIVAHRGSDHLAAVYRRIDVLSWVYLGCASIGYPAKKEIWHQHTRSKGHPPIVRDEHSMVDRLALELDSDLAEDPAG